MTDDVSEEATGIRIPDRPDFPVQWEDEVESTLLWSWDEFHSPLPKTLMSVDVSRFVRKGFDKANEYMGTLRPGGRTKRVNGYPYSASTAQPLSDAEQAERDSNLTGYMATVRSDWDTKWLPSLEADLRTMKAVRYSELDDAALWAAIEDALRLQTGHWFIHHRVVIPVIEQSKRLDRICGEILGEPGESVASILLHGAETLTVRSIKELEALAGRARSEALVTEAIEGHSEPKDVEEALGRFEEGRRWLAELEEYLEDFGYRCGGFDLSFPTWIEDHSFVFQVIRNLIRGGEASGGPGGQGLRKERDRLLARVRKAGSDRPELLDRFEQEYALGQQIWPLKENHSYYIDQASTAVVRIGIAEIGRRLQSSDVILHEDDIWYLDLDEAKSALLGEGSQDLKASVHVRREERDRYSRITPPKYLGTMPADHEAADALEKPAESGGTLRGTAASKGEASGVARVVLSPDDFHKVSRGDVLVCRSTAPMWTPLFSIVSALVSEAGGVLSHPAVVAREFNLPAVVGVANATNLISDGQLLTVSGTEGLVHTG